MSKQLSCGEGAIRLRIYTRKGDGGRTHVIGGQVNKDDIRVEAYGTVDECNALIGQAAAALDRERDQDLIADLTLIQHELFDAGADLAQMEQVRPYKINAGTVSRLESRIDHYEAETEPIRQFILPGGSPQSAALHVSRVAVRRAERRVVTLANHQSINNEIRRYLNRLSDLLFVLARVANVRSGVQDVEYRPKRNKAEE